MIAGVEMPPRLAWRREGAVGDPAPDAVPEIIAARECALEQRGCRWHRRIDRHHHELDGTHADVFSAAHRKTCRGELVGAGVEVEFVRASLDRAMNGARGLQALEQVCDHEVLVARESCRYAGRDHSRQNYHGAPRTDVTKRSRPGLHFITLVI